MLTPTPQHERKVRLKLREGKTLRRKRHVKTDIRESKMKHTYRVKARGPKDDLVFFKTRTKRGPTTIQRFATLQGFTPIRISL